MNELGKNMKLWIIPHLSKTFCKSFFLQSRRIPHKWLMSELDNESLSILLKIFKHIFYSGSLFGIECMYLMISENCF